MNGTVPHSSFWSNIRTWLHERKDRPPPFLLAFVETHSSWLDGHLVLRPHKKSRKAVAMDTKRVSGLSYGKSPFSADIFGRGLVGGHFYQC